MKRVSKQPEQRREEIIVTAEKLFKEKGFENTMMSDIAQAAGISQGLPYRYFKSKYELLDAVVHKLSADMIEQFVKLAFHSGIGAGEALERCFEWIENYVYSSRITAFMHDKDNLHLHQRISQAGIEQITPLFTKLIEQGNAEGCFNCPYPEQSAIFLLNGTSAMVVWNDKKMISENFKMLRLFYNKVLGVN